MLAIFLGCSAAYHNIVQVYHNEVVEERLEDFILQECKTWLVHW